MNAMIKVFLEPQPAGQPWPAGLVNPDVPARHYVDNDPARWFGRLVHPASPNHHRGPPMQPDERYAPTSWWAKTTSQPITALQHPHAHHICSRVAYYLSKRAPLVKFQHLYTLRRCLNHYADHTSERLRRLNGCMPGSPARAH